MSQSEFLAELDKKQEASIAEANSILEQLRGKGGRWWGYTVSHSTFDLLIGDCFGEDNLVFCLNGCEYLGGPTCWDNQNLKIIWKNLRDSGDGWCYTLVDESSGFRVECRSLDWRRNYDILKKKSIYRSG